MSVRRSFVVGEVRGRDGDRLLIRPQMSTGEVGGRRETGEERGEDRGRLVVTRPDPEYVK